VFDRFLSNPGDPVVKHNFVVNTLDGAFYSFAMSFVSLSTVMPVFIKNIGGSNVAVGLIPVIWTLGFNFPQVLIANYVRQKKYKKPLLIITALGQRLPWLLLGLLCWFFFNKNNTDLQLILFFACLLLAAIAGSINLPGWFDLVAKITPITLRGRLFASRSIIGAIFGILGGWIVKIVLDHYSYPVNFSILLFLAFIIMMISYSLLFLIKEKESNASINTLQNKEFFKRIPSLIIHQKNYRNFLIADSLLISSLMADAFYALYAIKKFSLSDAYAGAFTIIMMISVIFGNILFGYIADKFGHRINLMMAAGTSFSACMISLIAPSPILFYFVFVFSAFTATLLQLSRLTIIAEICAEEDRPTYIAITNLLTSPFILSGILGGLIANSFGYNYVFILAAFLSLSSFLWYLKKVKEPRILNLAIIT
jgi:MFS family permease